MNRTEAVTRALALAAALTIAGCSTPDPEPQLPQSPGTPSLRADSATLVRLEQEARALVRTEGCSASGECLTAAVGERACGGPRDYLVFCARSTDTAALHRKLAELRQAEMEMNRRTGAMSTCEFREPPTTQLVSGSCRAR